MFKMLWLLLPIAAAFGWYSARWSNNRLKESGGSKIPDEYIQGLNFLLSEQPDKALEVFLRIVDVDSETFETHILLGNFFRRRGEVDRAIWIHQNLITRSNLDHRHDVNALLELGRDYLKAGLLDRAEHLFKEVIAIENQKTEAYWHLKELYEQERDWNKAISNAVHLQQETGNSLAPVIAQYYCELGEAEGAKGQFKDAEAFAEKALSYDGNCVRASIVLGDMAFSSANYQSAIQHYKRVFTQSPKFVCTVLPMVRAAFNKNNDQLGYQHFLEEIRHDECGVSPVLGLLETYLKTGDRAAAHALLETEVAKPTVPLIVLREYIQVVMHGLNGADTRVIARIVGILDSYLESQMSHKCVHCGFKTNKMYWQCPRCHGWGTIQPLDDVAIDSRSKKLFGE